MIQLQKLMPVTPGVRHKRKRVGVRSGIQEVPYGMSKGKVSSAGRNNQGRITCWHRGSGNKVRTRMVSVLGRYEVGKILGIQWDPNRFTPLALVKCVELSQSDALSKSIVELSMMLGDENNLNESIKLESNQLVDTRDGDHSFFYRYVLLGDGMKVGDLIGCKIKSMELSSNYRTMLSEVPVGGMVYSISRSDLMDSKWVKTPGSHAVVLRHDSSDVLRLNKSGNIRSGNILSTLSNVSEFKDNANSSGDNVSKGNVSKGNVSKGDGSKDNKVKGHSKNDAGFTLVRMPSGELRYFYSDAWCTIGTVGCKDHLLESVGKAGINRARGIRPTVRGCAMNPVDHPHGGRTKGGRHDVTPWAKIAKGQPTRSKAKDKHMGLIVKTSRQVKQFGGTV